MLGLSPHTGIVCSHHNQKIDLLLSFRSVCGRAPSYPERLQTVHSPSPAPPHRHTTHSNRSAFRWLKRRPSSPPPPENIPSLAIGIGGADRIISASFAVAGARRDTNPTWSRFLTARCPTRSFPMPTKTAAVLPSQPGNNPPQARGLHRPRLQRPRVPRRLPWPKFRAPPRRLRATRRRRRRPWTRPRPWPRSRPAPRRRKTHPTRRRIRRRLPRGVRRRPSKRWASSRRKSSTASRLPSRLSSTPSRRASLEREEHGPLTTGGQPRNWLRFTSASAATTSGSPSP